MTFDFKPYTREEFLEVTQEVNSGQLGKDPDLAGHVAELGWSCAAKTWLGHPGGQAVRL